MHTMERKSDAMTTPTLSSNGSLRSTLTIDENTDYTCCSCIIPNFLRSWKKRQKVKMMCLTVTPLLVLTALLLWQLVNNAGAIKDLNSLGSKLEVSLNIGHLVDALQKEREISVFYRRNLHQAMRSNLHDIFADTDLAVSKLKNWPSDLKTKRMIFESKETFHLYLDRHRTALTLWKTLDSDDVASKEQMTFYTSIIDVLVDLLRHSTEESNYGILWRAVVAYETVIQAQEHIGREIMLGLLYLANGKFDSRKDYLQFAQETHLGESLIIRAQNFSPLVTAINSKRNLTAPLILTKSADEHRYFILNQHLTDDEASNVTISLLPSYSVDMRKYADMIRGLRQDLANHIIYEIQRFSSNQIFGLASVVALLLTVVSVSPMICLRILLLTDQIQQCVLSLADKTSELRKEKRRTETLLYQMLPRPVARKLKKKVNVEAEYYKEATIFFSSIADFEQISSVCSPIQIVELLNTIYNSFDEKIEQFDVYKVETIGDCYMVASGLPIRNGDRHCKEVAQMALVLMSLTYSLRPMRIKIDHVKIRVGIHTGPCVAGVVGTTLPRYCLFGDTVNTASRLQSSSLACKIQISSRVHEILSTAGGFSMKARGTVHLKGKGKMSTYWLVRHRSEGSISPSLESVDSSSVEGGQLVSIHPSSQETVNETLKKSFGPKAKRSCTITDIPITSHGSTCAPQISSNDAEQLDQLTPVSD